ncbi:Citrate-binding protein [Camellia lanceoleosa]|uniref:Citrate-binding protein n=1 Tax=Camellia lanceoleosa TaxID=1840588 RepID=A0ACC0GWV2_9ERIC|nr:Citrate-binding protein [Camellia lanceoleosa]
MEISHKNSLLFLVLVTFSAKLVLFCSADPTDGFILVPLTEKNFGLQKPYNVPLAIVTVMKMESGNYGSATKASPSTMAVEPGPHRSLPKEHSHPVKQQSF